MPERVDIGRIDEVSTQFYIAVQDSHAVRLARSPAPVLTKGHGTETQRTDAQAGSTESDVVSERHDIAQLYDGIDTSNDGNGPRRRATTVVNASSIATANPPRAPMSTVYRKRA